ncbi:MAG: amidohydrolase family protein [Flavobacteriaceae bacterium]|nr:amidohydrolase family protein [Eudoraea sp.]NNJ39000.1 amidohydrolase family protein [Flavobacteriaceae bacterium]
MKKTALALISLSLLACNQAQEKISETAILITNVHVVDVRNGSILENQQIVVDSGRIQQLVTAPEALTGYTNMLDAQGAYAVPGLAEMHAHIPSPPTTEERIQETLFLYLSNGITTIRGMLGHPRHLELREEAKTGSLLSPRIFTSSPSRNGNSVKTPEEARTKVTAYQEAGYDFLKIHPGIQRGVFDTLVKTANEAGIPFSGHVPVDVGIRHALQSRYASIDHVDGYLEGLVPESAGVQPDENGFFGYNFTPLADTTRIKELVALSKNQGVWVVPTQSLFERWFAPTDADEMLAQPEMQYMPVSTLENWKLRKEQSTGKGSGFSAEQWESFDAIRLQLIKKLQEGGQGLLLGSDAPQLFNVPGFSIHHEMAGMLRAGLSPLEILQSGTLNPASFFGMEDEFGEIKEGLSADFFLVQGNPLQDLANLRNVNGVMVRGTWIDKATIDQKLKEISANAAQQ